MKELHELHEDAKTLLKKIAQESDPSGVFTLDLPADPEEHGTTTRPYLAMVLMGLIRYATCTPQEGRLFFAVTPTGRIVLSEV